VYQAYFNVMKPMGIKPLLAIYAAAIDRTKYALTWPQLKKLKDEGCTIASHGFNHRFLNSKHYKKSPYLFKREIHLSKKILERELKMKVDLFVYPYGTYCKEAFRELRKAGYKYAFTIKPGPAHGISSRPLLIKRFMMTKQNDSRFIASLEKAGSNIKIASIPEKPEREKNISRKKSMKIARNETVTSSEKIRLKSSVGNSRKKNIRKKVKLKRNLEINEIIFLSPVITEKNRKDYESPGLYSENDDIIKPFMSSSKYDLKKDYLEISKAHTEKKNTEQSGTSIKGKYHNLCREVVQFRKNQISRYFELMDSIFRSRESKDK